MQSNTIRIIAAVVDTHNLMLYKGDGSTIEIPQGDPRIRPLLDTAVPQLVKQGFADITLDKVDAPNEYKQFEEASNGAVKLFRIAKSKLMGLFGKKEEAPVEPMTVGSIPQPMPQESEKDAKINAIAEILEHAVPVASSEFHETGLPKQGKIVETSGITIKNHGTTEAADTIIAVVNDRVIPGMEKIKSQFGRAASLGTTKGVEAFLNRLGAVIDDRKHSVDDLLTFMERGDLPIADDGSILIYKVLNLHIEKGKYVDCHTRKVEQWVGGYVCMDPSLVDHNRNNECSNGLHVARRGYVREFGGDVCVLAKVAPEDVIAVPNYDANKMRVCGYHIIAELSREQYALVKQNKPITEDPDGKTLLAKAMAGHHIGKTHEIRITGHLGTGVQVTSMETPTPIQPIQKVRVVPVEALANPEEGAKDVPLDPKEVVQKVEQLSRKEQAAKLYADYQAKKPGSLEALLVFKKTAKVSWEKLADLAKGVPVEVVVAPVKEAKKAKPAKVPDTKHIVNDVVLGEGSAKERIQKLLAIGLTSVGVAKAVLELKKKSKKSWTVLGVSDAQVDQITKLT